MTDQNTAGSQGQLSLAGGASTAGGSGSNLTSPLCRKVKHVARIAALVESFKKLLLPSKLKENKEIEDANGIRRYKCYTHLEDPDTYPDDGSSIVSFYPLDEKDFTQLEDPAVFSRYKDDIPLYVFDILRDRRTNAKRKAAQLADDDLRIPKKFRKDGDCLIPYKQAVFRVEFPHIYATTIHANSILPLCFFIPRNVVYIATHLAYIDTKKAPYKEENNYNIILDIPKILNRKLDMDEAKFKPDSELTFIEFSQAAKQMILFEKNRDKSWIELGVEGSWTKQWRDHFDAFTKNTPAMMLHEFWKHREVEMREMILTQNVRYSPEDYLATIERARMSKDTRSYVMESLAEGQASRSLPAVGSSSRRRTGGRTSKRHN
ncbi:hypothetical protein NP233_g6787 [Leucocoprinus birnbaumii]|uniref:Uncharacterized protein n=1 Tax=Leucocoprinus birnbaumii TaxID=56174 RepID=A0AAD5VQI0_9AGAR|nr:hypothetical protein NP233_g6787 [Leucocoprinus birnbaumii]